VHGQHAQTTATQQRNGAQQHQIPCDDQRRQPPRHHVTQDEGDQGGQDVEPVGCWIEQGAELAGLVEQPREFAVQVVGDPADHQDHDRPTVRMRAQQQVEKQRHSKQSQHAQGIGQRPCTRRDGGRVLALSHDRRRVICSFAPSHLHHPALDMPDGGKPAIPERCERQLNCAPPMSGTPSKAFSGEQALGRVSA
jgi:hypothetical protein